MILIAEVDNKLREFLVDMIRDQLGHPTIGAGTGREVIWHLKKISFDLILLNPRLPDGNGFDLLKRIRKTYSSLDLPVITLAGHKDRQILLAGFSSGANDCITLPFDPVVALARVKNQLALKAEYHRVLTKSGHMPKSVEARTPAGAKRLPTITADLSEELVGESRALAKENRGHGEADRDAPIPCEIPISLLAGERSFFCKTIWISYRNILLLSFMDLPEVTDYKLQLVVRGESVELDCVESTRQELERGGAGVLKLNLRISRAPTAYDEFYQILLEAFQEHGEFGLKAVLRNEDHKGTEKEAPEKAHVPTEPSAKEILSSTLLFSSASLANNMIEGTRYRFERLLGKGGFASIYLVRDMALKRPVAMKVLNEEFARVSETRNNFLCEAQIAAQFHHNNIVFVYEVGEILSHHYTDYLSFPEEILAEHPQRFIYFTMQYIEGRTLTQWIHDKENKPEEACIDIILEIVKALVFAHSKGVIHRDIKPDNIMVNQDGHVVVTDFGIANLAAETDSQDGMSITQNQSKKVKVACTPMYASPEQLTAREMDHRSDIYSFGVVAYEILAGEPPFYSDSVMEVAKMQYNRQPPQLGGKRKGINAKLEKIIHKCLAKKPEERFQQTVELLDAVKSLKGTKSASGGSIEETLEELLSQAIVVETAKGGAIMLEKLIAFLNLHKTYDNVQRINEVKNKLTDPSLITLLIEKNLNSDNQKLLYDFFMMLDSSRAVFQILHLFKKENEHWKKLVLGELAVLCAGRDLIPLAIFGLELEDDEACILLKGFGEIATQCKEDVFIKWAEHPGYRTQMELIKIVNVINRPSEETITILRRFTSDRGTTHDDVRDLAGDLLMEKEQLLMGQNN